jgi:xylulokinase
MPHAAAAEHVLAFDLGTSGPKVALVTMEGRVVASEFEPNEVLLFPGGGAEQRPADWWTGIVRATRRLLARGVVPTESVAAVCATAQWGGTVAVDARGEALGNAVIWMDTRGARYIRKMTGGPVRVAGYSPLALLKWLPLTGGIPGLAGKDSIAHILFLKEERPEVYGAAACFLEPKDWLNLRLTGRRVATFDSIALHWLTDNRDIHHIDYHPRLLRASGIDRAKLPDLIRATDVVGPLTDAAAAELGLPAGLPVVAGASDTHSAAVGSGAVRDREAHLYVGTSAWMLAHVPRMKTDPFHSMCSLPSALPGRYLLLNEQEAAGNCLTFLRDRMLLADDGLVPAVDRAGAYAAFDRLAATARPGSGGVIFTPWLYGERTPIEDAHVRGGFFNLSLTTTRAEIVRSVLEGVAYNARWLMNGVERFLGTKLPWINLIGGGAKSPLWCQIFADVLGRPIRQVEDPIHANIRGAAFLGAIGLGRLEPERIPDCVGIERTFEPDPAHRAVYDELFEAFVGLYKRNRSLYARLNP